MRDTTVAANYAETLFTLAERAGQVPAFGQAIDTVAALIEAEPRFRTFLISPQLDLADKQAALRNVFAGHLPPLVLNFLLVVLEKRRQRLIPAIAREYHERWDRVAGRLHVQVTLARDPDERLEQEIASELSRALGKQVIPHLRVNREILGGVVIRYGDRVLDGSLRRQLLSLRRRMLSVDLPTSLTN